MVCDPLTRLLDDDRWFAPFREPLADVFATMDDAYREVAEAHGFQCRGCEDNCCRTRFYHHTLAEAAYLFQGVAALAPAAAEAMRQRAGGVAAALAAADADGTAFDMMCPANVAGRCVLYAHRPMICRLHGLPSVMIRPDGAALEGAGCADFHRCHGAGGHPRLDRTPHYRKMAQLEQQVRRAADFNQRLKLSVADMILAFPPGVRPS